MWRRWGSGVKGKGRPEGKVKTGGERKKREEKTVGVENGQWGKRELAG
jgi:hypothetical protein